MKITLDKNNAKVNEMLKQMADTKNSVKALEAREAFAAFAGPVVQTVIEQAPVISNLYRQFTYGESEMPFLTLDAFFDIKEKNYIKVWSQQEAGGFASAASSPISKLPVSVYKLFGAVNFYLEQLRVANVDMVAKSLERLAGEILVQQEINAINPLACAVAQATFKKNGVDTYHVARTNATGVVKPADYLMMSTLMARINSSWVGGTPTSNVRAITDFVASPEFLEQVRLMAFEPINTRAATYGVPATDKIRDNIYDNVGTPVFAGVNIIPVYEMGKGSAYNQVFSNYAGSTAFAGYAGSGTAVFNPATEQVVFGIDSRQDFLVQLAQSDADTGATVSVMLDDQWTRRQEKIGYTAQVKEGRVVLDSRNCVGLVW